MYLLPQFPVSLGAGRLATLRKHVGFSLVEVTLALGVAAMAVLAIAALMPLGLTTLGEANDQTTEVHILNSVSAKLAALSFQQLSGYTTNTTAGRYDFWGQPLESNASTNDVFYQADVSVVDPVYAGSPPGIRDSLRAVRVEIKKTHSRATNNPRIYTIYAGKAKQS